MEWDLEMLEMRQKLIDFLDNNWIWYDNKTRDYVSSPNNQEPPAAYLKWRASYEESINNNAYFKHYQKQSEKSKTEKKLKEPLICEHCGYEFWSVFTGSFKQHHGDNCKKKKEIKNETTNRRQRKRSL